MAQVTLDTFIGRSFASLYAQVKLLLGAPVRALGTRLNAPPIAPRSRLSGLRTPSDFLSPALGF